MTPEEMVTKVGGEIHPCDPLDHEGDWELSIEGQRILVGPLVIVATVLIAFIRDRHSDLYKEAVVASRKWAKDLSH